jgi:hypothetical protein
MHQSSAVWCPQPGAGIPTRSSRVSAQIAVLIVVPVRYVMERGGYAGISIEQWIQIADAFAEMLIDERDQTCPERSYRAGSAHDDLFAIQQNLVTGLWVSITGDIRDAPAGTLPRIVRGWYVRASLPRG